MTRRKAPPVGESESGIGFGSPPERAARKYDWAVIAKRLKRAPNKWLLVFEQDKTTYYSTLLQGSVSAISKDKGFEIRSANTRRPKQGPRTCDLWLRYVPENDTTKGK